MKYFLIAILFLLFSQATFSQAISGSVFDAKTGEKIVGASVFFASTSIGTITNEEGYFSIDPKFNSNTYLVITHIGYKTFTLGYQDLGQNLKIPLVEEFFEIPEVVLISDPFTRKQKLEVFRLEFLGDSDAGLNSKIVNEEDLELYFNSKTKTLSVHSKEPIIVLNDRLGYEIQFNLVDFQILFRKRSLDRIDNIISTIIYGYPFFKDISKSEKAFLDLRNRAYLGSIQHFMRTIWNQSWADESFEFYHNLAKIDAKEALTISAGADIFTKKVSFKWKKLNLTYKKGPFKHWSTLNLFAGNTITIDRYGSYMPYLQLKFGGEMSDDRIGDLLPLDFELNDGFE